MTQLNPRLTGWSGVLAGIGLLVEWVLWTASGWKPDTFDDPATALAFLDEEGTTLRWAVLSGFTNLVFLVIFLAGLAANLRARTPTLAAATLLFGMIGSATHVLVPMAHWYGVPAFLDAMERDRQAAEIAWSAFVTVAHDTAGGAGSLFLGLAMLTAGCAIIARQALAVLVGWLGLLAGLATVVTVFHPDTPLTAVAGAMYLPSLILAILFRIAAGLALIRWTDSGERAGTRPGRPRPARSPGP
jgi:hypothetical protein